MRIKLFENFSNSSSVYLWPEAAAWIEDLYPEEICFLAVYNGIIEYNNKRSYSKNKSTVLFPMELDGYNSYDLESDDYDDDGECSFELFYEIPSRDQNNCTLSFEISGRGHFTSVRRGGYMEPDEGGEPVLDDVDAESIYYLDSEENLEIDFSSGSYTFKSDIISKKELMDVIIYAGYERIEAEDNTKISKPEIPQKLIEKCEEIRKNYPDIVKGGSLLNRFGIFGTK